LAEFRLSPSPVRRNVLPDVHADGDALYTAAEAAELQVATNDGLSRVMQTERPTDCYGDGLLSD